MAGILSVEDAAAAAAVGWELHRVWDTGTKSCSVRVFPTANNALRSSEGLHRVVVARAQNGDKLAQHIFQLIMEKR